MFFGGEEELERKTSHTQALPSSSSWSGRWDDGKNKVQGREGCGELCMRGELVMSEDASRVKHLFGEGAETIIEEVTVEGRGCFPLPGFWEVPAIMMWTGA